FDVAAWIKNNLTESEKQKVSQDGSGLKVAGSDPNKKEDDGIGILMSMDKDETTQKLERDAQAEIKRQQNALPAWHLKSTITGDLTALGVKETARTESNKNLAASNDDLLRGLGVVGGSRPGHSTPHVVEDKKPNVTDDVD
ncbi:hypothetical protein C0993_003620, partial [Termitomyces sp. T159_Od127]